jgi:hypothetical protein
MGGRAYGKCQSPSRIGGEVGYCWGCWLKIIAFVLVAGKVGCSKKKWGASWAAASPSNRIEEIGGKFEEDVGM